MPPALLQDPLLTHLAQGLLFSLLLAPFWRRPDFRRTLAWVWLALLFDWAALALGGLLGELLKGLVSPAFTLRLVSATGTLLTVIALLSAVELTVWDTLARRRHLPRLIWDLVAFAVTVAALFLVLSRDFGVDLTALLVTSTVLSAVVGLALQDTLRNFIAGIALQVDPPFAIGDWVQLGDKEGEVTEFSWRTLAIRTRENNLVHLPNGLVANAEITNFARPSPPSALDVFVGVAYPHPPGEVIEQLLTAATEAEGVVAEPAPRAFVHEYADFAVVYRVRVWLADWSRKPLVRDAVLRRLWYRLRRAGMTIPFPIRDVNLRSVREDAESLARLDREEAVFQVLRPLALLAPLRDDQVRALAADSDFHRFTRGELLFTEGEPGDSLVVVQAGSLRVEVAGADGRPVTVAHRGPGDYVGEMSLLTGEPRSATIRAETEVAAVVVPRAAAADLVLAEPEVLDALSEVLAARVSERDSQLAEASAQASAGRAGLKAQILERMRRFFLE